MNKSNQSVVRNQAYTREKAGHIERHNERKNEHYGNGDVDLNRTDMNIHFKQCETTYLQEFDRMIADGTISMKGLKKDGSAKIIDELIFDVNSEYFEQKGGYEYAKSFFEEAYRMAVNEVGEDNILSAVMHADERNKILSEQYGHDIYHYHLHVVYIPVVEKEVLWTKRCKDPALEGTVKEKIKQVSHSKKWASHKEKDENGKEQLVYSYSLLQDRYHDHMKNAGYIGFERGTRGSTNEHLSVAEYKTQQETERAAAMTAVVEEKQEAAAALDTVIEDKEKTAAKLDAQAEKKQKHLDGLNEKTAVTEKVVAELEEIAKIGHKRTITGAVTVPGKIWDKIINLIKEVFKSRKTISDLRKKVNESAPTIAALEKELAQEKKAQEAEKPRLAEIMDFNFAKYRAPKRLAAMIADIKRQPPEQQQNHTAAKKKSHEID